MLLKQVFPVDCIKIGLESEYKEELFEELVDIYIRANANFADRTEILRAIAEREALMSTGIKKGIAIPHGKTGSVSGIKGVIGISSSGIDYESLDGEPVYLVFLLLSSPSESEQHLRVLRNLAILLDNPSFKADLLAAASPDEANRILQKYEDNVIIAD